MKAGVGRGECRRQPCATPHEPRCRVRLPTAWDAGCRVRLPTTWDAWSVTSPFREFPAWSVQLQGAVLRPLRPHPGTSGSRAGPLRRPRGLDTPLRLLSSLVQLLQGLQTSIRASTWIRLDAGFKFYPVLRFLGSQTQRPSQRLRPSVS